MHIAIHGCVGKGHVFQGLAQRLRGNKVHTSTKAQFGINARSWLRELRRPLVRAATFLGPRLLPQGRQIVFVSAHSNDPDALVILEYLARQSQRPLVWLGFEQPDTTLLDPPARSAVLAYRVQNVRGLWAFLTSSLVFHTYGLYDIGHASRRQIIVNVWHGDGPKVMRPHPIATTFMVTGVEAFGARRMQVLGLSLDRLLSTGRPRVDDIHTGYSASELTEAASALGLDERPIVWWLPTWREDGSEAVRVNADFARYFTSAAVAEAKHKYQFVVKPHPNNPPQQWPQPWKVLSSEQLTDSSIRWYRMLGTAAAIITDYSSVSSDFLNSSIPMAFIAPDAEEYAQERKFYMENWREFLPGPFLDDAQAVRDFLSQLEIADHDSQRDFAAKALGSNNGPGATQRLFDSLSNRGIHWR